MDSLNDILSLKDFTEPPETAVIKKYVQANFRAAVGVLVQEREIIIIVPNSGLANTLRLRTPTLQKLCQTDKRLRFRIG
jgi:hypothetical protein